MAGIGIMSYKGLCKRYPSQFVVATVVKRKDDTNFACRFGVVDAFESIVSAKALFENLRDSVNDLILIPTHEDTANLYAIDVSNDYEVRQAFTSADCARFFRVYYGM